ncbi:hypothetical protein Golax_016605, partial [Gossypium laxum]|nr:hypothetical protein [Gossypium laxum]
RFSESATNVSKAEKNDVRLFKFAANARFVAAFQKTLLQTLLKACFAIGMGSDEEERLERKSEELKKINVDTCIACLWSFLVSLSGALMLGWWGYEYHPTNSQLWLVPFGLILFVTPLIIWFAIFVSYFCNFTGDGSSSSLHDPEKMIDHVIPTR